MSKKVKFTKNFGKVKAGEVKKYGNADANNLVHIGLAEHFTDAEGGEGHSTRMLTAGKTTNRRRQPRARARVARVGDES